MIGDGDPALRTLRTRELDVEAIHVPGRVLRWLFAPADGRSRNCSVNVAEIGPWETVTPAHSHPSAEEIVYVLSGQGQVLIDGEVGKIETGTAVLFPIGSVHMVRNTGARPLRLVCFFAPPMDLDGYRYHESVTFPAANG